MQVLIAGAGSVGRSIARELLSHGHEVTIIDRSPVAMRVASVAQAEWILADACEVGAQFHRLRSVARQVHARREGAGLRIRRRGNLAQGAG